MPTFIYHINVIIPKDVIEAKFKGGTQAFHKWFIEENGDKREEDNELFSIARLNAFDFVIEFLVENGLHYDFENKRSDDFGCVYRYGGSQWQLDWLNENGLYAWHKDCKAEHIQLAQEIAEESMEEIADAFDRGEWPWNTIR